MSNLVIVESPAKCSKIESILGPGWIVKASYGHIRDLPDKQMGVSTDNYVPNYVMTARSKQNVVALRKLAKQADQVYLATDPDREGEAISWHLREVLNLKRYKRATFNEITRQAVSQGIEDAGDIDLDMVKAQEGRRIIDRLVGYTVSPAISKAYGSWITAGRVQSIAVRIVVDREKKIQDFKPTDYFDVLLSFDTACCIWKAKWLSEDYLSEGQEYIQNSALAESVAHTSLVKVISSEVKPFKRRPPAPFITSTLQQAGSTLLKFSPKRTMELAQKLFDEGLITYHRTDNPNLSETGYQEVTNFLENNGYQDDIVKPMNTWKTKANAQEGHEAIRPTSIMNLPREVSNLFDSDMADLYRAIWFRTTTCQMKSAEYILTRTLLESVNDIEGRRARFVANGKDLKYAGWLKLAKSSEDLTNEENPYNDGLNDQLIPELVENSEVQVLSGEALAKKTKSPARYTEASLVKKLEDEGVGRPSTYASILENVTKREYVAVESRKLHATELGFIIYDLLAGKLSLMEMSYTRDIETQLDE